MAGNYADLAEHAGTLVTLLGGLAALLWSAMGIIAILYWRIIARIEKKLDNLGTKLDDCKDNRISCRDDLAAKIETRVSKDDFKTWQNGRVEIWDAINHHTHDAKDGKVKR